MIRFIKKTKTPYDNQFNMDMYGFKKYLKYIKKGKRIVIEGKLQGVSGTVRIIFQKIEN
jgi:hypothetical protein